MEESYTGFEPGSNVLFETDDTMMLGVIHSIDMFGVLVSVTHKMDVLGLATDEDRREWRELFSEVTGKELRQVALRILGFWKTIRLKDSELVEAMVDQVIKDYNLKNAREGLRVLSKPIRSWYALDRIKSMESAMDRVMDVELADLDFPTPKVVLEGKDE